MVRIIAGQVLTGSLFNEPMRVETVQANGPESWVAGLVGTQSERFRKVTLAAGEFERLTYRDVTRFVKRESARAAAEGEDPRARAIGFLMSLYQRRLASSTYAMRHFLSGARRGWARPSDPRAAFRR